MQQKINKTKHWCALLLFGFFGILLSCSSDPEPRVNVSINVDNNAPNAADGFNLEQFHRLLLEEEPPSGEWDAAFLSELVNREDINNLDLNQDGTVDQIFIEPFGGGDNVGFQLYTQVKDAEGDAEAQEQTICTVGVEKESDGTGSLSVSGNEQVYGDHHHYHSGGMGIGSYMMLAWMMSPRYPMMGGYGYGGYGGGRRVVSQTTYNKNISDRNSNHTGKKAPAASRSNTASSATAGAKQKTASNVKAGLKKPTSTQRKFQTQQKAKKGAGGFAKKPSGTSKSTSAGRSSSARSRGGK